MAKDRADNRGKRRPWYGNSIKGLIQLGKQRCDVCDEVVRAGQIIETVSEGVRENICRKCQEFLYSPTTPAVSSYGSGWGKGNGFNPWLPGAKANIRTLLLPECRHHLQPFAIDESRTIYLSAISDLGKEAPHGPLPHSGAYFHDHWVENRLLTNDGTQLQKSGEPAVLYGYWPDFGVMREDVLDDALGWARKEIDAGKVLEVGCYGGHGRTGTFAAALAVAYGREAKAAISAVRKEYCKKAIENEKQEKMIMELEERMKGANRPATGEG